MPTVASLISSLRSASLNSDIRIWVKLINQITRPILHTVKVLSLISIDLMLMHIEAQLFELVGGGTALFIVKIF